MFHMFVYGYGDYSVFIEVSCKSICSLLQDKS